MYKKRFLFLFLLSSSFSSFSLFSVNSDAITRESTDEDDDYFDHTFEQEEENDDDADADEYRYTRKNTINYYDTDLEDDDKEEE